MKFRQFFQKFFRSPTRKISDSASAKRAEPSEKIQKMLMMLSDTRIVELTCDEVFALLDQFVDLAEQGEDVEQLMPLVQHHLDMCEDCREEYKVLKSIVHGTA